MLQSRTALFTACLMALQLAGCSMVESPRTAMRRMTRTFTPRPVDADDDSERVLASVPAAFARLARTLVRSLDA